MSFLCQLSLWPERSTLNYKETGRTLCFFCLIFFWPILLSLLPCGRMHRYSSETSPDLRIKNFEEFLFLVQWETWGKLFAFFAPWLLHLLRRYQNNEIKLWPCWKMSCLLDLCHSKHMVTTGCLESSTNKWEVMLAMMWDKVGNKGTNNRLRVRRPKVRHPSNTHLLWILGQASEALGL